MAVSTSVPFLDLTRVHAQIKDAVLAEIAGLIDSGAFTNGPQVAEFEQSFAAYCGRRRCVGVASGLDALRLGLIAIGVERGAEVIIPANTFVATAEALTQAGARPVLVDVSEKDYNIDPAACEAAVTSRTQCILPVHLYGQMANMRALTELAARKGLQLVEDACQAHGATRDGIRAGAGGRAAAFSFYPAKNLGAMGDAGALVTDDADVAERVIALREHGQRAKYVHDEEGWTARLDTIQAIVLAHKLPFLDEWNEDRRRIAAAYDDALDGVGDVARPPLPDGSEPVWHIYVIQTADPTGLAEHLAARGIATGRHYPQPLHLSPAYQWLGYDEGDFPVTERIARHGLSLPVFPGLTEAEIIAVTSAIAEYFDG